MITGVRYSYHDGGSVDIKYPRQKFDQGTFHDVNQANTGIAPIGGSEAVQGAGKNVITLSNGMQVNAPSGSSSQSSSGEQIGTMPNDFVQAPQVQGGGGGGSSGGGGGGMGGMTSGIFGDVAAVYNDLRQNTSENQQVANQIFNRNVGRKNLAMAEATTASNLRGAGQTQQQNAIQFGENQSDRAGQLKLAGAWASGVAKGLTAGRT